MKIFNHLKTISNWGVNSTTPEYLRRKIVLCNQVGLTGVISAGSICLLFPKFAWEIKGPFIVLASFSIALILNRFNYTTFGRYIVAGLPSMALTLNLARLIPDGYYIVAGRVFVLATITFVLVLFDLREKWKLWLGVFWVSSWFLGFEWLNDWLRAGTGTATFVHNAPFRFTVLFFCIVAIVIAFYYQLSILNKAEDKAAALLSETNMQKEELRATLEVVAQQNNEITDSILYARRIQHAILPPVSILKDCFPDAFIYYQPKDVVSGDFYWMLWQGRMLILGAFDCTGHGVPGAFMAVLGATLLHQIIKEKTDYLPGDILDTLNIAVKNQLQQYGGASDSRDGMDGSLVVINPDANQLLYAGANNPLYYFERNNPTVQEIKADKFPVGGGQYQYKNFTTHTLILDTLQQFYLFSDGYADQFGGTKGKKFMYNQFRKLLTEVHTLPADEQHSKLVQTLADWQNKGNYRQVDDILVIGVSCTSLITKN